MREKIDTISLRDHFREIVESLGYEYIGVEFAEARSGTVARTYIDAPNGAGHMECESASRHISAFLDESEEAGAAFFQGGYYLEVSSPGLERPLFTLEHYCRFVGRSVAIKTTSKKKLAGQIASCEDGSVKLVLDDGATLRLALEDIERANLVFTMIKGEKKGHKGKKKKPK